MLDQLTLLNKISDELNKDLDLDNMLQRVIDLTVSHFQATTGSIVLFDEQDHIYKYILQRKLSKSHAHEVVGQVLAEGFAGWVLKNCKGDVIMDTAHDERWCTLPNQPYTARSVIATPLVRLSRVLGVLTINHVEPNYFRYNDLDLLNAISAQAAIALENAQLFYQTELERAKLSTIINGTQDVIIVTDESDNKILLMNPAAKDILSIKTKEWFKQPIAAMSSVSQLTDMLSANLESVVELQLTDGRTFDTTITDVPNVGRLTIMHDITALKELDNMKREFVAAFTHDLAAPLATIKQYIEFISSGSLTEIQQQDLQVVRLSVQQMRKLIQDLIDLTRIESLKSMVKYDVVLQDIIYQSYTAFSPMAVQKNINLNINLGSIPIVVQGNPALIARAVENLIENAIKYTNSQGTVTITLQENNEESLITIEDTGIGIPAQKVPYIFNRFFRAHPVGDNEIPGSGLGLSIVKTIVERHDGRVSVESTADVGSTFVIFLPVNGELVSWGVGNPINA